MNSVAVKICTLLFSVLCEITNARFTKREGRTNALHFHASSRPYFGSSNFIKTRPYVPRVRIEKNDGPVFSRGHAGPGRGEKHVGKHFNEVLVNRFEMDTPLGQL